MSDFVAKFAKSEHLHWLRTRYYNLNLLTIDGFSDAVLRKFAKFVKLASLFRASVCDLAKLTKSKSVNVDFAKFRKDRANLSVCYLINQSI